MCYQQGKLRIMKTKTNNHPLINNKKYIPEPKDKENEKYNIDYSTKPRSYYPNDFTATTDFDNNKNNLHHINLPYSNPHNKDRYAPQPTHNNYFVQTTKTLTFANVKTNVNKPKNQSLLHQQSSQITFIQEQKKPTNPQKNNVLMEKDKYPNMTERIDKPLIDKANDKKQNRIEKKQAKIQKKENKVQKKENNPVKIAFANKNITVVPNQVSQIDDFACTEELDFKPVQKKSIVPEKKYTADKTTSKFDFAKPKKSEKRNDTKDIKDFEAQQKILNMNTEGQALNLLCQKQEQYAVDSAYIQKNHKTLIWWSRAILVDWMRHICYEFGLQRDTYHIAVVLLDNYLARITNVSKSILQAIGATTLFIASKLEEFQCKESREFAKSTNNSCSVQDIHELEIKIVNTLKFKLNPPTLYSLANKTMSQWDIFLNSHDYGKVHPLFNSKERVFFKQVDQKSYTMFRELMQLIDCSVIDIQTVQYKPRLLVCSFMYLLIGRELKIFNCKEIVEEFPCSSLYLLDESNQFNDLFRSFVEYVFGFSLFELLPTVQYCSTYFGLNFSYEKPVINEEQDLQSMSFEEYCSYQTYNSTMIKTVKNRYRGIY